MRNRDLHEALRQFALDAAALLSEDLAAGAEIPFDVLEEGGRGPVLYNFRPLTEEFLGERWKRLRALPTRAPAVEALRAAAAHPAGDGPPRVDPEPALLALLERLWQDASGFDFPEQRFEHVYAEVEELVYRRATRVRVVVPLCGPRLEPARLGLDEGLALVRPDLADVPAEAQWGPAGASDDGDGKPGAFCVLDRRLADDAPFPIEEARARFAALEHALRLLGLGSVALGPLGWVRAEGGGTYAGTGWHSVALGAGGTAAAEPWTIYESDENGLGELLAALEGRDRTASSFDWALERFMSAGGRESQAQALSDHLLGLRALLDAGGDAGRTTLPLRVAALCAEEPGRPAVQRGIEVALGLERCLVKGGDGDEYAAAYGMSSLGSVVATVEDQLRSLLRDVVCGYLQPDLSRVADEILLHSSAPVEIEARDMRVESSADGDTVELSVIERSSLGLPPLTSEIPGPQPVPAPEPGPQPLPEPVPEPDEVPGPDEPTVVPEPAEDPDLEPVAEFAADAPACARMGVSGGVHPSFEPDFEPDYESQGFTAVTPYDIDEDAESYAAPA